jgi:hypothetical protein
MRTDNVSPINHVLQAMREQTMMNQGLACPPLPLYHHHKGTAIRHILITAYYLLHQTGIVVSPVFPTMLKLSHPIPTD